MVAITLTALITGADRRQTRIHDELQNVFADVTYSEVDAVIRRDPDNPDRLDDGMTFVDVQQIIDAISAKADGFRSTDNQIEIRWPALFFGFRRCVSVTWTPCRTGGSVVEVIDGASAVPAGIGRRTRHADLDVPTSPRLTEVHIHVKRVSPVLGTRGVRQTHVLFSAVLRQQDTRAASRLHGVRMCCRRGARADETDRAHRERGCDRHLQLVAIVLHHGQSLFPSS